MNETSKPIAPPVGWWRPAAGLNDAPSLSVHQPAGVSYAVCLTIEAERALRAAVDAAVAAERERCAAICDTVVRNTTAPQLRGQLQTLGLWIADALTTLDTVEPECSTEAELLTALIRRGEMLVLASPARGGALVPSAANS